MTLPFENDTKTIIKRISRRNISANRKRNIFIIITIALASTLLSAITLYGFGITQKTKNLNKKTAQIVYHAISEKEGSELYRLIGDGNSTVEESQFQSNCEEVVKVYKYAFETESDEYYERFEISRELKQKCIAASNGHKYY